MHNNMQPRCSHADNQPNQPNNSTPPHTHCNTKREEEFFDREAVLGRDAASVFPKEAAAAAAAVAGRSAMVEALGARKFISGTEVCVRVCVCACACGGVLCSVCWCV